MTAPWDVNVGNQTMYCSDCHGADDEEAGGAKGPHGSNYKFMLKGERKYWPVSSTGKLFSLNDISGIDKAGTGLNTNWANELFCLNCHDSFPSSNKNDWKNEAHREHGDRSYKPDGITKHNTYCVACHSVIPHGNKRSRLIVYRSEPAPYTYQSGGINYSTLQGFRKAAGPFNYDKKYCWTLQGYGCDEHKDDRGSMVGGYDP
jgi:cytochrome c553